MKEAYVNNGKAFRETICKLWESQKKRGNGGQKASLKK